MLMYEISTKENFVNYSSHNKVKVTLYKYTYQTKSGEIEQTKWTTMGSFITYCNDVLLKTEAKEIEIDE